MGTRHNIRVKLDGEIKVRQYGQWDGYPSGQGAGIANFLQNEMDEEKFKSALRECSFMTVAEIERFNGAHAGENWQRTHPWLSRDAGSDILGYIQSGEARRLVESKDDEDPETWCEFFYLIDMDLQQVTMTSRHARYGIVTLRFSEWTEQAMNRIESESDPE